MPIFSSSIAGEESSTSDSFQTLLSLKLPAPVTDGNRFNLTVFFNAPYFFTTGGTSPGAAFQIAYTDHVGGSGLVAAGSLTHQNEDNGRSTPTLIGTISLKGDAAMPTGQDIQIDAQWAALRGSTITVQSMAEGVPSATLTAMYD